jgi:hypothetical protein
MQMDVDRSHKASYVAYKKQAERGSGGILEDIHAFEKTLFCNLNYQKSHETMYIQFVPRSPVPPFPRSLTLLLYLYNMIDRSEC